MLLLPFHDLNLKNDFFKAINLIIKQIVESTALKRFKKSEIESWKLRKKLFLMFERREQIFSHDLCK